MAIAKHGADGPLSGKVKNLVYSTWNGIPVVKSAPVRNAAFSEKQLLQQWLFKITQDWLTPIGPLLKIGFKGYTRTNQGITAAKSYMFKNALIKDGYDSTIDPSLMRISNGDLPAAENISMELNDENKELIFTWDASITRETAALDQVLLLAYNTEEHAAFYSLGGDFRKNGTAKLSLANAKPGVFHVYVGFVAEDKSRQSDSVYLGSFNLSE